MKIESKVDLSGFNNLKKALDANMEVRVGVLSNKNGRNDTQSNASVGATHEFGSVTNKIPARSWLRMPIQVKIKEIQKAIFKKRTQIEADLLRGNSKSLFTILGLSAEKVIQDSFESGGFGKWAKLNAETIKRKGSSAPLIDSGQLRRSVTSAVVKKKG
tara:strand:- start:1674 stop:2150 length:477 start_codon:yes stop_codon:yes gene_type:complete